MQRVTDFVERMKKVAPEMTIFIKRVLFKEERDFIAGIQKIIIARALLFRGLKDGRMPVIVETVGKFRRPVYQLITFGCGIKSFENEESVTLKLFESSAHNV